MNSTENQIIFIYSTFPDLTSARSSARQLTEDKLIACANIFPEMHSTYWWENKIEESTEVVAIFKTKADLFDRCEQALKKSHPYTTPCIVAINIANGNADYLTWITQAVEASK
ncbi:MAG: hypothetical protein RJB66_2024 [Pseudomonadota bacterium]|jgi:periplasmic divalent cation tolerance protein